MHKNPVLFLISVLFLSFFQVANADVVIDEIMYAPNDGDTDWVEIYNNGSSDVTIKTIGSSDAWRISTSSSDTPAKYNLNGPNFTIQAGGYVILACDRDTFLSKHSSFSVPVIDITSSGFSNSGGILKLWNDAGTAISTVNYGPSNGANNTGESMQLIGSAWMSATPTPGIANIISTVSTSSFGMAGLVNNNENNTNFSSSTNTTSTTETKTKTTEEPKIETQIIAKNLVFAGTPTSFQTSTTGLSKEKLFYGKYFWNFGDGDSKEVQVAENQPFTHTYFYPGDYVTTLEYYSNSYSDVSDASDKITIKAVSADVSISAVGNEADFFVELSNNTIYDADISNWILASSARSFAFPKDTIIGSKKKMTISPNFTHFSVPDKDTLKLTTPQGKIVFDYGSSIVPIVPVEIAIQPDISVSQSVNQDNTDSATITALEENSATGVSAEQIPAENLEASAVSSNVVPSSFSFPYMPAFAFVFIGASAGAVYFIRQKKVFSKAGDDFKILEE